MNTEQEKQYIVEQRALGQTFVQIGKTLGKSGDSVRVTFNRIMNSRTDNELPFSVIPVTRVSAAECKYCGKKLVKAPKGEKRKFCSAHCRNAFWNERKRRVPYSVTCEYCGRRFISFGNPDKRFCGRKCFADSLKSSQGASCETEVLHD